MLGLFAAGGAAGLGIAMIITALVPGRPDLLAALRMPGHTSAASTIVQAGQPDKPATGIAAMQARFETWLAATHLTTPDGDLAVIGMRRGEFLLTRVALTAATLLVGPIYLLIFTAFGLHVPAVIPAGIAAACAALVWVAVASHVTGKADQARLEMRHSLVAFLQLVALHRAAGAGPGAALDDAAAASPLWTFRRIKGAIDSATRAGHSHWQGIADLAEEMGVDELADLSAITAGAGTQGAAIYDTLLARATSLRAQLQTDEIAAAQVASGRMAIPKALLAMATMAFLLYPAITQLTAT
ncbi:MAG: hypothetical protein BGO26_06590 [Actinobacteria bacterium 69-20]|nr:MAG: hypothetical protein BGO26_06590 [Actinobacteria bacterium 69-20]